MAKSETANGGGNGLDGRGLVSEVMPGGEPLSKSVELKAGRCMVEMMMPPY